MHRLLLFGGASLEHPSGPVSGRVTQRRRLALLTALALSPSGRAGRGRLVGLLWPERPEGKARHSLADSLYIIRQELGEGAVIASGDEVRLEPESVWCDVIAFEELLARGRHVEGRERTTTLEEAVALYRGPLLDGFYVPGAADFDEWTEGHRRRLANLYGETLEVLAESAERRREWPTATKWWKRRAAHEPTNSRVAIRLMEALAAEGNTVEVHQHLRMHEALLQESLGLNVPAEVREVAQRLMAGTSRIRVGSAASVGPATGTKAVDASDEVKSAVVPGPSSFEAPRAAVHRPAAGVGRRAWVGAAAAVLLAAGTTGIAMLNGGGEAGRVTRIAVLPFETLSPDPSGDGHLADGFHDELLSRLATVPTLGVIARTSVIPFRGTEERVSAIAEQLEVDAVVEGGIRRTPNGVLVTVRLVDGHTEELIWSEIYDRELNDLYTIQGELSREIAIRTGADATSSSDRLAPAPTTSARAYELYLEASAHMRRGHLGGPDRGPAWREAVRLYRAALELDSGFALAHARLGMQGSLLFWFRGERSAENRRQIREAVRRASELDPRLPDVQLARAWESYYVDRDFERTLRIAAPLEKTMVGHPDLLGVLAATHRRLGDFEGALDMFAQLASVDPLNGVWAWEEATTHLRLRRWRDAERIATRAIRVWPEQSWGYVLKKSLALAEHGDLEAAERAVREGMERTGSPFNFNRADIARLQGRYEDGLAALEELGPVYQGQHGRFPIQLHRARLNALAGRRLLARAQYDTAATVLEGMLADEPALAFGIHHWLALAYAGQGRRSDALREGRLAIASGSPAGKDVWHEAGEEFWLARIAALAGETELALDILARHLEEAVPSAITPALLRLDPEWNPLRNDARFQGLLDGG